MRVGNQSSRRFVFWAVLSLMLVGLNTAVDAQEIVKVPDGTLLVVQLKQSVRADHVKPGDQIRAKLLAPMLKNGESLLPTGANILGAVVEAEPLALSRPSRLLIRFEQVHWKHGSAELNAYLTRYLVLKRTYGYESREFCPPVQHFRPQPLLRQAGNQQAQQKPTPTPMPPPVPSDPPISHTKPNGPTPNFDDLCHKPFGTRAEKEPLVFTSPVLKDIVLRKLESPSGATVLESNKKNVSLPKGMIWEIRHNDSDRSGSDTSR